MRHTFTILMLLIIGAFVSCRSTKKFQASYSEDKPLFAAINELNKKPGNQKAQDDLRILYPKAIERHEEAIAIYKNGGDESKWDKILSELNALQNIYNSLQATAGTFSIVTPKNYLKDIEETKQDAAADFYDRAQTTLVDNNRESYLKAYNYFKRSSEYVFGYKDTEKMIRDTYEKGILYVVINPIEDDNIFYSGWGFPDARYRPQDYQESLVRDLGGKSARNVAARFYTDREVRRENIVPDIEVAIRWRNMSPLRSIPSQYSRQVSKSVQDGKDTSGHAIYKTVYATLNITQQTQTVRADLEYRITNINGRRTIDNSIISDEVSWSESYATYTGDSRALSQDDWLLVNNRNYGNNLSKGDLLNNLMRKMYPELRRRLQRSIE